MNLTVPGTAAGVPFVAIPPAQDRTAVGMVVAWHWMDQPGTARSMAAALPLDGLDAWRIYLELPRHGSRAPVGRSSTSAHRCADEPVADASGTAVAGAAKEFPGVLAALLRRLALDNVPLGLLGGGAGATVAQLVLAEAGVAVRAVALVDPGAELDDPVARVDVILKRRPRPAIMLVADPDGDPEARDRAERLWYALSTFPDAADRAPLLSVPNLRRALAHETGTAPAPRIGGAARIDAALSNWFRTHLTADIG